MTARIFPKDVTFNHTVSLRTRWVDEDNQKVLNNAIFMTLFEEARLHYFGKTLLDLLPPSLTFPFVLLKTDVRFLKSGKGGRAVFVDIKTTRLLKSSFVQWYRVRDAENGDLWSEAEATLVCFDFEKTNKKMNMPDHFRRIVSEYENIPLNSKEDDFAPIVQTNKAYPLTLGMWAEIQKKFGKKEVLQFAHLSEDYNPLHLSDSFAKTTRFGKTIVHGYLFTSLISGILGAHLPGTGTVYLSQTVNFKSPVFVGDTVTMRVEITHIDEKRKIVTFSTICKNLQGKLVSDGSAKVMVPAEYLSVNAASTPTSKL